MSIGVNWPLERFYIKYNVQKQKKNLFEKCQKLKDLYINKVLFLLTTINVVVIDNNLINNNLH